LTLSPIRDAKGYTIGVSAIARNITEAVRMERQLQEQTEQLAGEARSKDEFLAMLAHELRNPMAPLCNGIDALRILPPSGEEAKQILDMMEEQTHNLVRLIDDLLDVSRVTRGKMELKRQRVALATIITNAVQTAEPLMQAKGHELTVRQARERLYVHGDPTRLTQVVANLLNNAAKYTPPGGKILLSTARIGDQGAIRVKDNGSGIASDMLPRIFEMFVQADNSLSRTHGGLGIGLTLVKSLVKMHGGTVEATSDGLGKGSQFTVRLPVLPTNDVVREEATDSPHGKRSFPSRHILVVDDWGPAAFVVATLLRSRGQQVRTAAGGTAALAMIAQEKPELILSDISMPEMNGYELAQEIRRRPEWNDIRLVAVTGYGQESDKMAAKEAGFNDHLVKPISITSLEYILCR
jgi:CheY-like chemotaxis protein